MFSKKKLISLDSNRELSRFSRNRDFTLVIFLAIVALVVRLISLHYYHFIGVDGGVDGVGYAVSGKNLFSGLGYSIQGAPQLVLHPLYSILIGASWFLTRNLEFSGQIISVIAGSLLVVPVFYLTRGMYGRKAGLWTAIFIVICPPLIFGSTEVRLASLYTLLLSATIAIGWKALGSKNLFWWALTGLMLALCYLTRSEAIMFLPIFLLLCLLLSKSRISHSSSMIKLIILRSAVLITVFVLVSFPFWHFLYRHTGKWMSTGRAGYTFLGYYGDSWEEANFELVSNPETARLEWLEQGGLMNFVISNRQELLARWGHNVVSVWSGEDKQSQSLGISPWIVRGGLIFLILFISFGFIKFIRARHIAVKHIYLLIITSSSLIYFFFGIDWRYFYPYFPFLLLALALVVIMLQNWSIRNITHRNRALTKIAVYLPITVLLLAMGGYSGVLIGKKLDYAPYEYKIMGEWMKKNVDDIENKIVMSRKIGIPFYAEARHEPLYYGEYPGLIEYARSRKVDYLVIDEWTIPGTRPQFVFLLEEGKKHPGLELAHTIRYKDRKTILYRVE